MHISWGGLFSGNHRDDNQKNNTNYHPRIFYFRVPLFARVFGGAVVSLSIRIYGGDRHYGNEREIKYDLYAREDP